MLPHYPKQWMNDYDGWQSWTEDLSKGHGYVALKIVQANTTEARILKYRAQCPRDHPGSNHVMKLRDHFVIKTTNGSYDGLALELVGLNVFTALENSPYGKLSRDRARRASVQAAMGLTYMHQWKVGHGDLHSGNVCFAALDMNNLSEAQIMSHLGPPYLQAVRRRDGKAILPSVPSYTVKPSSFTQARGGIKIIDLGQAFFFDRKPERIITPVKVKAPELLLSTNSLSWDYRVDLWALGCLVYVILFYEFFVGKPAFNTLTPKALLLEMTRMVRDPPHRWQSQFNSEEFLNPDGTPREIYEGPRPLEETLKADYDFLGGDMTPEELKLLAALLRELLVLEPEERKSASEIVDNPWLCGS
ncbi:uncharacterized protein BP5553_07188 [Venustampulla echinocandica]|uniref:Protein kinase domain-containing protein n=1 Tax=Venustampulla echinocandica TaxID=2656787 RepID=A0A370TIS9_9HELO|nr:uncharacterized protein BP5553_07188 [Venustampulla echinocandica]RDL35257.1 hypothetical protein BP5553_07188 [Venustampulla echinocandica]